MIIWKKQWCRDNSFVAQKAKTKKGITKIYYDRYNRTVELKKLIGTSQKSGALATGNTIIMTSSVVLGDSFIQINEKWVYCKSSCQNIG